MCTKAKALYGRRFARGKGGICASCGGEYGAHSMAHKRGLCWRCYRCPVIRESQPKRSPDDGYGLVIPKRMPEPTDVLPGRDKVAVLQKRAQAGEHLWHPLDARDVA